MVESQRKGSKKEFTKQIPGFNKILAKYSCVCGRKRGNGVIEYGCNLFCRQVFYLTGGREGVTTSE